MHELKLARMRLLLLATLAFGCSSTAISGSYAAIAAGFPGAAPSPLAR